MPGPSIVNSRTVRRRAGRLLAPVVAAVVLLLGPGAGSASAHDVLVASGPAEGSTVGTAPGSVTLEFTSAPQPLGTQVVVTGPDGAPASRGNPALQGATVSQPLAEQLPPGIYAVDWRVTSADGHPLSGSFRFTVAEGAATGGAVGAAEGSSAVARPTTAGSFSFPAVWFAVAGIGVVAAASVVRQLRRPV